MYIPSYYKEQDHDKLVEFIKNNSFGLIINTDAQNKPIATHLPFVVNERDGKLFLVTHLSRENEQWQYFKKENKVLVVFQGPHSYISPSNYEKELNVPTWNYISVHAYGFPNIYEDEKQVQQCLEQMINVYEANYQKQYQNLPQKYKAGLMKGIVAFEIEVTELQGKYKLSQNKTQKEKENIIHSLGESGDSIERALGDEMRKFYKKP